MSLYLLPAYAGASLGVLPLLASFQKFTIPPTSSQFLAGSELPLRGRLAPPTPSYASLSVATVIYSSSSPSFTMTPSRATAARRTGGWPPGAAGHGVGGDGSWPERGWNWGGLGVATFLSMSRGRDFVNRTFG